MAEPVNLKLFGSYTPFEWTHEYLYKILTEGNTPFVKGHYLKNAFRLIRRDDFVPRKYQSEAFEDKTIVLDHGEELDKPTVIAKMLDLLEPKLGGKFLDIGTGTGWTAALLGFAAGQEGFVYSMERNQFLAETAKENLSKYPNIKNTKILFADGSNGLPEYAPYDGIHITVAYKKVPQNIQKQLKIGGKLVIPTTKNDIRLIIRKSKDEYREVIHRGYFFKPVKEGVI